MEDKRGKIIRSFVHLLIHMYSANMYSLAGMGQALCSGDTDVNKSKGGEVLLHGVYTHE